jgi:hypothetical protein
VSRAQLQEIFDAKVKSVRSREYPYVSKRPARRDWSSYDAAQENEFPEVVGLVGSIAGKASESFRLAPRFDAIGREPYSKRDVAKLVLAQQYDGRRNRVSIGLLSLLGSHLGITGAFHPTYKALERAYEDPDAVSVLNEAFFLTQLPVKDLEHDFSMDGTRHPTTIKENWESSKDEILRLTESNQRVGAKERKRHEFEKTVLAVGTAFKIIASFARTRSPFSNESPYLRPLLEQVLELYAMVAKVCVDSGPPLEGELHPDREGGRSSADVPQEGRLDKDEGVTSLEEDDDAGVHRGHANLAEGASLALGSGDRELYAKEAVRCPAEEEARGEEGHRTPREDRGLQHQAARLPEVYGGDRDRHPIYPEARHPDELDGSLKVLSQSRGSWLRFVLRGLRLAPAPHLGELLGPEEGHPSLVAPQLALDEADL